MATGGCGSGSNVDKTQLKLIVRWTKDGATGAATKKYDDCIGTSPPITSDSDPLSILAPFGICDVDPGGLFQLEKQTITNAESSNLEHPEVWNKAVVARWNFQVRAPRPFSLSGWKRKEVDPNYTNTATEYTSTQSVHTKKDSDNTKKKAAIECVGSTYKIHRLMSAR